MTDLVLSDFDMTALDGEILDAVVTVDMLRESARKNVANRVAYEYGKSLKPVCANAEKLIDYFKYDVQKDVIKLSDAALSAAIDCGIHSFDFVNRTLRDGSRLDTHTAKRMMHSFLGLASIASEIDANHLCILMNFEHNRNRLESGKLVYNLGHLCMMRSTEVGEKIREKYFTEDTKATDVVYRQDKVSDGTITRQLSTTVNALQLLKVCRIVGRNVTDINFNHALFRHVRGKA